MIDVRSSLGQSSGPRHCEVTGAQTSMHWRCAISIPHSDDSVTPMSVTDIRRAFVEYREIAAHWATRASGQAAPALDGALGEEDQLVYTRHVHTAAEAAQACASVADLYWRELNA